MFHTYYKAHRTDIVHLSTDPCKCIFLSIDRIKTICTQLDFLDDIHDDEMQ